MTLGEELEQLYRLRYVEFVRVATAIVGTEAAGIDVVQESFAKALAHGSSFQRRGPLSAWVWRIVVNTARTQAKALEFPAAELEPNTNGSCSSDAAPLGLVGLLTLLPERQLMVVFLRYYADLDYRSIAEIMEVKLGTVSASLNAAHVRLRGLMEEVR